MEDPHLPFLGEERAPKALDARRRPPIDIVQMPTQLSRGKWAFAHAVDLRQALFILGFCKRRARRPFCFWNT